MASNVKVQDAVVARLKADGENYEILVDCDKAILLKEGKDISIRELVATEQIFTDSKRGEIAKETSLQSAFGTNDRDEIIRQIVQKGDIQLTAEHRKKVLEEKTRRILGIIHRNGIDPKTDLPHPMTRLENAFETAKIRIDEFKDDRMQAQEIITKLRPILPIKFAMKDIQLSIPAEHTSKMQHLIRSFGKLKSEDWQTDGSLIVVLTIPGGMEEELYDKANSITSGSIVSKVLRVE